MQISAAGLFKYVWPFSGHQTGLKSNLQDFFSSDNPKRFFKTCTVFSELPDFHNVVTFMFKTTILKSEITEILRTFVKGNFYQ